IDDCKYLSHNRRSAPGAIPFAKFCRPFETHSSACRAPGSASTAIVPRPSMPMMRRRPRRDRLTDAIALETQDLNYAVPYWSAYIKVQCPFAVHFEHDACPIGTLCQIFRGFDRSYIVRGRHRRHVGAYRQIKTRERIIRAAIG